MTYTYIVPSNIQQQLIATLRVNGLNWLSELLINARLSFNDLGLAFYAGMKGDNWDKHAVDCNISVLEKDVADLQKNRRTLEVWIQRLFPSDSGLLVRNIVIIPEIDEENVSLPEVEGDTWDTLSRDINHSLSCGEPALVLDRLHTFSVKLIRELCGLKGITTADDRGNQLPLHSLAGMLVKYYQNNGAFQSEFSLQAMKSSISVFDKYNEIRNDQSYAHDNDVLNEREAMFAVKVMTATISFIYEFENL